MMDTRPSGADDCLEALEGALGSGTPPALGACPATVLDAALRRLGTHETHLIVSASGAITAAQELGLTRSDLDGLADITHNVRDIGATIASGSFVTTGLRAHLEPRVIDPHGRGADQDRVA